MPISYITCIKWTKALKTVTSQTLYMKYSKNLSSCIHFKTEFVNTFTKNIFRKKIPSPKGVANEFYKTCEEKIILYKFFQKTEKEHFSVCFIRPA